MKLFLLDRFFLPPRWPLRFLGGWRGFVSPAATGAGPGSVDGEAVDSGIVSGCFLPRKALKRLLGAIVVVFELIRRAEGIRLNAFVGIGLPRFRFKVEEVSFSTQ